MQYFLERECSPTRNFADNFSNVFIFTFPLRLIFSKFRVNHSSFINFKKLISIKIIILLPIFIIITIIICKFWNYPYNAIHRNEINAPQNERRRRCLKIFSSKSLSTFWDCTDWRWRQPFPFKLGRQHSGGQTKRQFVQPRRFRFTTQNAEGKRKVYSCVWCPFAWTDTAARSFDDQKQRFVAFTLWFDEGTLSGNPSTSIRGVRPVTVLVVVCVPFAPLKIKGAIFFACNSIWLPSNQSKRSSEIKKGRLKSDSNFKSGFRRPFVYYRLFACFRWRQIFRQHVLLVKIRLRLILQHLAI